MWLQKSGFLQFLAACDRVFYMKTGSLVEQGAHDDLLESGGQYADFFSALTNANPGQCSSCSHSDSN